MHPSSIFLVVFFFIDGGRLLATIKGQQGNEWEEGERMMICKRMIHVALIGVVEVVVVMIM